jgi:carbon-monoxide dehydrogenase medium subunit
VIPSTFSYQRAGSVEEAISLVSEHGDDAKFLAGGHSLLPLMKLRLAAPEVIIDLGGLHDLSYVDDKGSYVAIGALTRHHDVEHSEVLAREVPLLAHAAGQVGDPQIRHRGTIGGSIAHADPASDLPAVLLTLDATIVARGPGGSREIPIGEFFQGLFETALEPDELLTEIRVPKPASAGAWSFQKFTQRAIDWAIVGCAVQDGAARHRDRSRPGRRRLAGRRRRARCRGHQRRRRHPRHQGLPRAPGPRPGLARPHRGKFTIMIPNGPWRVPWHRDGPDREPGRPR